jgi:hypothetical protein
MKRTLILAFSVAGALGAYAQGTVNFTEASDVTVLIYAPSSNVGNGPNGEVVGNSAADTPSGSTAYTGGVIGGNATSTGSAGYGNGNNYTAELYGAAGSGLAFSALAPLSQYTSTFATKAGGAGQFLGSNPSPDPGIPGTGTAATATATLSLAAWYNGGGTITSLAAAEAAKVPYGWSTPFSTFSGPLGGTGSPPNTPPDITGLTSFSLVTPTGVPEPGTITLGIMGAAAFLMRRRSK